MFGMGRRYLGIDLGTASTIVFVKGKGIVVREPSVVAVKKNTNELIAVGNSAMVMMGRTPGDVVATRPMRDGVIADYEITIMMTKHFLKEAQKNGSLGSKPTVLVCVPSQITTVERRAVIDAVKQAGARDAFLIEEVLAAAIGAGLPVWEPTGSMVVDIGGGTTEIGVLSLGGIVTSQSLRVGGYEMDKSIMNYIRKYYNLMIGERMAESIKMEIGSAVEFEGNMKMEIRGRDLLTGLPKTLEIQSEDVWNALKETVYGIVDSVKSTLENTPPELSADIMDKGIILTGGGALLHNLDNLMSEETQIPVLVADNPLECVAIGTGKALDNIQLFKTLAR